ncbi:hypothetical protein [Actinoplanes sp. ATCC 53533]|uniref:hypothetical protein n=1 Tax=Actinoplanes sp. ATCC 53533 TaxID=1288362 RepID=UPI000F77B094|nr:hypothetical protein [Actinoplanes sp. ATCC 53533]
MVEVAAVLNSRQLEVLRWIAAGCPDGVMLDFTYKTAAVALQGRRLVTASKRHGRWFADVTPAGRFYLDHGRHPARVEGDRAGDKVTRKRPTRPAPTRRERAAVPDLAGTAPDGRAPERCAAARLAPP